MAVGRSCCCACGRLGVVVRIIDCVEKNLQTSYHARPLYFSFPLWNHSLPARLTQFLHPSSSLNRRAQEKCMMVLGRHVANTLLATTG